MAIPDNHEGFKVHYDFVQAKEKEAKLGERPCGIIQWKGTGVCMDVHCPCGWHMHFDEEFLYYVKCSKCGALYAVGSYVALVKLEGEQKEYVEKHRQNTTHTDEGHPACWHDDKPEGTPD